MEWGDFSNVPFNIRSSGPSSPKWPSNNQRQENQNNRKQRRLSARERASARTFPLKAIRLLFHNGSRRQKHSRNRSSHSVRSNAPTQRSQAEIEPRRNMIKHNGPQQQIRLRKSNQKTSFNSTAMIDSDNWIVISPCAIISPLLSRHVKPKRYFQPKHPPFFLPPSFLSSFLLSFLFFFIPLLLFIFCTTDN